jgi:hypothetical protein
MLYPLGSLYMRIVDEGRESMLYPLGSLYMRIVVACSLLFVDPLQPAGPSQVTG